MSISEDLLPRVALYQLCDAVRRELADLIRQEVSSALEQQGLRRSLPPGGALKAREAAKYIGLSRARLYQLLQSDPNIKAASITQGRARLFLVSGLNAWLRSMQTTELQTEDRQTEAATERTT